MRRLAVAAFTTAFLTSSTTIGHLTAAKTTADYPVRITFRDIGLCIPLSSACLSTDKILSDGLGAYVNGGGSNGQVNALIHNASTNSNTNLILGLSNSGTGRTLQFFYRPEIDVVQPTQNPPSGYLNAVAAMVVNNIGAMSVNHPTFTSAQFNTDVGFFRFGPAVNAPYFYGSQQVVATRTSLTTWTISTDSGDLDVLLQRVKGSPLIPVGLYHMPFSVDVTCISSNCPP